MNIFGGRPGIAAGVLAVIAILAASFFTYYVNIAIFALALIFVVICIVLCACKYIKPYRLFVNTVVTLIFCAALLRGVDVFYREAPEAEMHCGENKYIHATVTERRMSADYYTVYTVKLHSIDGIEYDGKAVLNCEYSSELQEGYEFVLRNAVVSYVFSLEKSDAMSFVSEKIFLSIETENSEDCEILSEGNFIGLDRFRSLNSLLCAKLRNGIKGEEGRLAAAMLLGDKEALTSVMYRDFSRAGLSHYLAVSGLHVSIITGVVSFLLLQLRIKRWLRNLLIALFAVSYLFLLGFPVSAVRSVAMLLTVFFAYSMGDSSDSLNALGIAAVLIILIEPTAVFEKSFILSFGATLGIVCFTPLFNDLVNKIFKPRSKDKRDKKLLRIFLKVLKKIFVLVGGTFMSISAASSLTLIPVMYLFGETSVLGYRSNLAVMFAATPLLVASLFYLIFGGVPGFCDILKLIITSSARFMIDTAAELSETRGAVVSLVSDEVESIVLVFSILIYILLVVNFKHKKPVLFAPISYLLVIFAIMLTASATLPTGTELTFISTGKDENILAVYEDESVIIDISDGSLTRLRAAASEAHELGITEFDTLILTHYHTRHLSSVSRFIAEEMVRKVILPYPQTEADAWVMAQLVDTIQSSGCECDIIEPFDEVALPGGVMLTFSDIFRLERSAHPMIYLSFSDGDERVTYVGESSWERESTRFDELIYESGVLFFGGHGPVAKVPFDINVDHIKYLVISDRSLAEFILNDPVDGIIGAQIWKYTFTENNN